MKRRDLVYKILSMGALLKLGIFSRPLLASKKLNKESKKPSAETKLVKYVLPENPASINSAIQVTITGNDEFPILIPGKNKIWGQKDSVILDVEGTYTIQYVGKDLGWNIT